MCFRKCLSFHLLFVIYFSNAHSAFSLNTNFIWINSNLYGNSMNLHNISNFWWWKPTSQCKEWRISKHIHYALQFLTIYLLSGTDLIVMWHIKPISTVSMRKTFACDSFVDFSVLQRVRKLKSYRDCSLNF